jgi:lipid A ethanolaminephosphotransferase
MTILKNRSFSLQTVVLLLALYLTFFANLTFFRHVGHDYGLALDMLPKLVSVVVVLAVANYILLTLISFERTIKWLVPLVLVVTSQAAYFMDLYDVVIDINMIQNVLETNWAEARDLLSVRQLLYLVLLGLVPSYLIWRIDLKPISVKRLLLSKLIGIVSALVVVVVLVFAFSKFYASFIREHKPLRYYANPGYYLYSLGKAGSAFLPDGSAEFKQIGLDARQQKSGSNRRLVVLVVGEASRWDHFSLNGYQRKTNPLLEQEQVISFANFTSCGTETAVSVPCMFSVFGRNAYSKKKADHTENVLDVLNRAGVSVIWRDNNSDSKGVAKRIAFEDFRKSGLNPLCDDGECRDEGLLSGLDAFIEQHPVGDILIVLHPMGNHGPAYHKRYPASFERFAPVCRTNQLEQCSREEIVNAYDNALLYGDYFLSKSIGFLKRQSKDFQTALFYMSDHGESLGENGVYLHGLPYSFAPEAQTRPGVFVWFGETFPVDKNQIRSNAGLAYSHDNLFHSLLGLFDIQTSVYKKDLDMFAK